MFVLCESPDQGKEEKRLMIGPNPKAEVAPSSVSRNRGKENQFLNRGRGERMQANLVPNSGWRKRNRILDKENLMPSSQSYMHK